MKETEISYEEGAFEFTQQLFGRQPADDDLARLAGALDGATVNVSVRRSNMLSYPFSRAEFEQEKAVGVFNPHFTYEDYLQMIREQEEIGRESEEKARREGYELGAPQLELTPEDEAALDRAWARVAAEKAAASESLKSGFMSATYAGRPILTPEEFRAEQAAGWFNPESSYDDYLAMIREQEEIKREAEEKARREGYELGAPQIELTPEDEAILDRVWAKRAAEKAAAEAAEKTDDEDEQLTPARAA